MWPLEKNAPPLGSHVFQANVTIFKLIQDTCIIETNLLTKCHEDWTINVATLCSAGRIQLLTKKNAPPTGGHVFQATGTIFKLVQNIIGTKLLTKFHDDRKMPRPLGGHVFPPTGTIFELIQDIIGTNHLTKFHDDRTINVASRVLTRKNAPPPNIIRTNLLTKFHEDRKINLVSRVLTRLYYSHIRTNALPPLRPYIIVMNLLTEKNAPPLGNHVFQANTNLLTKFHEEWTINVASRVLTRKTAPPPGGHVFSPIWTIFKLVRDINETNVLIKFHDDWAKIVTSRVFTRNTALPPGGHVFQRIGTIFKLNQHIIMTNILTKLHEDWASNKTSTVFTSFELSRGINGTNVLTKFHEDQTINVASRVFTRQNVDDGRRTKAKNNKIML
ncbi:hypothetical protein DPMN_069881 [Dreissena polymorpha]|uniref:Uncharacterized protein n=1 Tax=Dreissena polymorpha TaxID=45954 RepID=A0A9D4BVA0_DREPO|nr:hypothetical protein DPMN_069881 [Dreissena polymorpha]